MSELSKPPTRMYDQNGAFVTEWDTDAGQFGFRVVWGHPVSEWFCTLRDGYRMNGTITDDELVKFLRELHDGREV